MLLYPEHVNKGRVMVKREKWFVLFRQCGEVISTYFLTDASDEAAEEVWRVRRQCCVMSRWQIYLLRLKRLVLEAGVALL